jgi:hypothetical protein
VIYEGLFRREVLSRSVIGSPVHTRPG